uniref:G-protein coupled receptors family 1 profile domain-containing protein n=2 Tax=Panagrolaimus sp. PS1159 TaxID=55785 RepID=A0AC35FPR1_9BILA
MVSFERMTAVIWPLKARTFWTSRMLSAFVIAIWICAPLTTMHWHVTHHIEHGFRIDEIKNETTGEITITETPRLKVVILYAQYLKIGVFCEMIMLVFVPVILVLSSNILMIVALRQKNRTHDVRIKRQRRATLIVFIIASTFAICQIPSAILYIVEQLWPHLKLTTEFRNVATLSNSLVVTGKSANFFLFCTWSSYFRKNLKRVIANKMPFLYSIFGKSIGRIKSTSRCRDSKNQLIEKIGAHRIESQPQTTRLEYCPIGLRVNHSYPLTNHSTYHKAEDAFIEQNIGESITFLTVDANVITPVTNL